MSANKPEIERGESLWAHGRSEGTFIKAKPEIDWTSNRSVVEAAFRDGVPMFSFHDYAYARSRRPIVEWEANHRPKPPTDAQDARIAELEQISLNYSQSLEVHNAIVAELEREIREAREILDSIRLFPSKSLRSRTERFVKRNAEKEQGS